ncbi:uncharacterized protein ACA1_364050 [Acanthamoeba castellanii str. Neff]|uniref:Golgin-84 n=1 Tax=Acanthamoeba castellanii (strain ATCC 30010 / Neff) TaxID=1257118 RepID=L8GM27_ACACF|nr:uncharacterized protein ACA1_364050 [Acanthamoeba castellanii str. Neff]ELR13889.1 hypothetical protein ACA1_364050 [Acanthamoeba castellanii str. Neff]
MENKLMRSEVRALNDEVTSLTERITGEHEALERANDALHALQMEVLDKDRQLMRLRKQEDEFDAVLAKKDAQHAALQVKLEETSLHVTGLEQTTNALKQEIDRLHREKDETNDLHKQSIALINAKIVELENQLKEERESASSQRSLALERERNLESDISEYTKALGQAQRAIEDKNKQVEKHMSTIKELEANVQGLKQELTDYKLRAKKVLQQRETTIQELTEKLTSPGAANAEEGELQEKWKELMLQKQAYESLKNEFDETRDELNKIKQNLAQTQEQAEHDALEFEEQVKALEDELEREKEKVKKMQFELAQKMQELHTVKDQQNQATNGLKEQVKERDAQIAKLKRQITVKGIQSQSSSQAELESSLSAMTDRLIRLQALNETLTNEKAALQMRLNSEVQSRREREGVRRSGEVDTKHSSGDITSIIINTGAEPREKSGPRLRSIASLVPESWSGDPESKRHQVYTHTLRAASALDNFTAQVGRILRRNPLARLLLILYMVFLHVWVLFLLSRPLEIHDMMDESLPPGAVPPTGLPHALVHSDSPAAAAGI